MNIRRIVVGMLVCCAAITEAYAQEVGTEIVMTPVKKHKWTVYGGVGPNYYLNNLVRGNARVNEFNYSFVARLMWEPQYFLSLGVETGYNRMYSMSGSGPFAGNVTIVNVAIPIQVVISMQFFKHYYCNFNMGQAILLNKVTTDVGDYDASVISLGDFAASVGYKRDISERFTLAGEFKGYYSAKLNDRNVALLFMAGYRLW